MSTESGAGGASGNGANGGIDLDALTARLLEKLGPAINEAINRGVPAVVQRSLSGALPELLDSHLSQMAEQAIDDPDDGFEPSLESELAAAGDSAGDNDPRYAQLVARMQQMEQGYRSKFAELDQRRQNEVAASETARIRQAVDAQIAQARPNLSQKERAAVIRDMLDDGRIVQDDDGNLGVVFADAFGGDDVKSLDAGIGAVLAADYANLAPPPSPTPGQRLAGAGMLPRVGGPRAPGIASPVPPPRSHNDKGPQPHPLRTQIAREVFGDKSPETAIALLEADPALNP